MIKYRAHTMSKIENAPGTWNSVQVGVFRYAEGVEVSENKGDLIGTYVRNYSTNFNCFWSFEKNGRTFALYSPHYTATRVMEIFDDHFVDIGGEEPASFGFCPTDFYVPTITEFKKDGESVGLIPEGYTQVPFGPDGYALITWPVTFGFVSGCVWGDDSSDKLEMLDLSRVEEGIITRKAKFGYLELPPYLRLHQAIDCSRITYRNGFGIRGIQISVSTMWDFDSGEMRTKLKGMENQTDDNSE